MYPMIKERVKHQAIKLREEGSSIKEISKKLDIAQSTVSLMVRNISLSHKAKDILLEKRKAGRIKATQVIIENRKKRQKEAYVYAEKLLTDFNLSVGVSFLIASVCYECEGGKSDFGVLEFTNSDPVLIKLFLLNLRKSFVLDERKFRVIMHLHSYHNEKQEQQFWSGVTSIPQNLFTKTFQKKESGINKKDGYHGCVQIKYFDVSIKRTLLATKHILANKMGL